MRSRKDGEGAVGDLEARFAEVEKRVRLLVTENKTLSARVRELEQNLAQARRETEQHEHFEENKLHIREKIERILQSLETANVKE
jgi:multidrug resistance efflux pump